MASSLAQGPVQLDDGTGQPFTVTTEMSSDLYPGWCRVAVYRDGVLLGTPIRFKLTENGKVAADLPGVPDTYFATQDGHIADG